MDVLTYRARAFSVVMALLCGQASCDPTSSVLNPPADQLSRTYLVGWAPTPPEPTEASIIRTAMEMARVSELALIQQHVPWSRLFAGETLADLVELPLAERHLKSRRSTSGVSPTS